MLSKLKQKIITSKGVFHIQGIKGVASLCRKTINRWSDGLNWDIDWYMGKVIEMRGNKIKLEGCQFSLNNPAISNNVKGLFIFNRYENPEREVLKRYLNPKLPVVEFGGSIGIVACLTNKKLNDSFKHIVVEANPDILPLLEENRNRNSCNFTILNRAVAYGSNEVTFYQNQNLLGSSVQASTHRSINISTITLRDLIDEFDFGSCTLICDIEGGEGDLVKYESDILSNRVATLIIEVHEWVLGPDSIKNILLKLGQIGFTPVYKKRDTYVFQNKLLQH